MKRPLWSFKFFSRAHTNVFVPGERIEELEMLRMKGNDKGFIWLEDNRLTLNLKKTNSIVLKSHKRQWERFVNIVLNGNQIK